MATVATPSGLLVDSLSGQVVPPSSATAATPAATPPAGAPPAASGSGNMLAQLQSNLLTQSGIISSDNTQLEDRINKAITGIQAGADASGKAIGLNYDRQIGVAEQQGQSAITNFQESQRGFAVNTAALSQLKQDTDRQVKDLESRKQELILQGQSAAAGQVSQLQIQAIQFHQQAQQQVFTNLLGMANFGLQQNQQEQQQAQFNKTYALQQKSQSFSEQQAISQVALQYGLKIAPGDTLASITTKAMPFASQEEQLQLQKMKADIAASNASAQASLAAAHQKAVDSKPLTATEIASLAAAYNSGGQGVLAGIKDPTMQALVINKAGEMEFGSAASNFVSSGISKDTAVQNVVQNSNLSASQKAAALAAVNKAYAAAPTATKPAASGNIFDGAMALMGHLFGTNGKLSTAETSQWNTLNRRFMAGTLSPTDTKTYIALDKKKRGIQ